MFQFAMLNNKMVIGQPIATFGTQLPGNYVLLCQDTAALIVQAPWLGGWLQGVKEVGQKVRSYGDADEIHIICLLVMIHNYIIIMYLYIYTYIYTYTYIYISSEVFNHRFSFNCIGIPSAVA